MDSPQSIADYVAAAMRQARCEILSDDGTHYCEIPVCRGVWSNALTLDEALVELCSALEGWIELGIALGEPLPVIEGERYG